MTCREAIAMLGGDLEAAPGAAAVASLGAHIEECDECVAYLNTYRRTSGLARAAGRVEMPPGTRRRLRAFLGARLADPRRRGGARAAPARRRAGPAS